MKTDDEDTNMTIRPERGRGRCRWALLWAVVGCSAFAGACDRAHLSSYYGQSFNAWFVAQRVHAEPAESEPTKRALTSLDSQEATAISKNYRRNVGGGQGESAGQGQMVMIGTPRQTGETYTPPPSVPGGQ
jgi:hypothetical protein